MDSFGKRGIQHFLCVAAPNIKMEITSLLLHNQYFKSI
ncbi:hypothetical protein CLOLEP_01730 [[Clostridium] leptum DSM 753]|uniref:Uncharacterized protein n=1 Tax=[Clostridium] leptum DSM 753 TaxID=428125 RepID=A7VT38_9FIRM|nr:hypothetical protein CLOLEP_01730 [[Clostridium] leptum DSM 753]